MNSLKPVVVQTWWVYHQGIYLANPLTIVLCAQLDICTEAIVMKVTSRKKETKRVSLQKVQADDLHSIQLLLHYAPVDDLHYSRSTMQRGLCSSQLDHMNEETWSQAIGTSSKKFPQVGWHPPGRLHTSRKVRSKCGWQCVCMGGCLCVFIPNNKSMFMSYYTKLFVGILACFFALKSSSVRIFAFHATEWFSCASMFFPLPI